MIIICVRPALSAGEWHKRRRFEIQQKREKDLTIVLTTTTLIFFALHLPRLVAEDFPPDNPITGWPLACMRRSGCLLSLGRQISTEAFGCIFFTTLLAPPTGALEVTMCHHRPTTLFLRFSLSQRYRATIVIPNCNYMNSELFKATHTMYESHTTTTKMTGGTPEVRSDKSLTLMTFNI